MPILVINPAQLKNNIVWFGMCLAHSNSGANMGMFAQSESEKRFFQCKFTPFESVCPMGANLLHMIVILLLKAVVVASTT